MITLTAPSVRRIVRAAVPLAPSGRDRALSAFAAIALHGLLFFGGGAFFVQPAEYGVDAGESGIEVELIAAPPPAAAVVEVVPAPQPVVEATVDEADLVTEPVPAPQPVSVPEKKVETPAPSSTVVGDGSSSVPGLDATTFHSRAGAMSVLPSYLKNPAPRYPEAARQAGQEGVVLLRVEISSAGKAEEIAVRRGSGFELLDAAAVNAVRKWKFRPAKAGSIPVPSSAEIPVRFQLDAAR